MSLPKHTEHFCDPEKEIYTVVVVVAAMMIMIGTQHTHIHKNGEILFLHKNGATKTI